MQIVPRFELIAEWAKRNPHKMIEASRRWDENHPEKRKVVRNKWQKSI